MSKKKQLTTRDYQVINFLEETNLLITAELASKWFYKSPTRNTKSALIVAQRRLAAIHELKQVNRCREHIDQKFIYYKGARPTETSRPHKLMITEFLVNFANDFEIIEIKTEFKGLQEKYGIRPDIYITFRFNNRILSALVECDRTKDFTSAEAYAQISKDWRNKQLDDILPYPPVIVSCCKKKPDSKSILHVRDDFSDFSVLKNTLTVRLDNTSRNDKPKIQIKIGGEQVK